MDKKLKDLGISQKQFERIVQSKKLKKPKILKRYISDKIIKLGVVSDTHICSIHEKLDELHTFYDICQKVGVDAFLHAGDIVAGWGIYHGQENEVHTYGAMAQSKYVIDNYPKVKGLKTYFITGNHCESWWRKSGVDVGELISTGREDMDYLGMYDADLFLSGIRIRLHHGDGGGSYALSYKGQKYAEQIPSGRKPRLMILGHWHTSFYFFYRNIHILNAGCFESQSLYLARKMLNPAIGGWIVELRLGKKRNDVIACQTCWIPFF